MAVTKKQNDEHILHHKDLNPPFSDEDCELCRKTQEQIKEGKKEVLNALENTKKRTRKNKPKYWVMKCIGGRGTDPEPYVYQFMGCFTEKDKAIQEISNKDLDEGWYQVFQIIAKSCVETAKTVTVEK